MKFGIISEKGETNVMEIDLSKIKSPDPLAFAYGYHQGKSGLPIDKGKGLALEYIRGFKQGASERKKLKGVI